MKRWIWPITYLGFVLLLALVFAEVEIQIEGANGWASSLPTWKKTPDDWPILNVVWGGRAMTGYHCYVFSFMALVFHLPIVFQGKWCVTSEARCLASLMIFWTVEDFLWFALNPGFDMKDFRPGGIAWHPHWFLGLPIDYWAFSVVGAVLFLYSFRKPISQAG